MTTVRTTVEPILLVTVRVETIAGDGARTNASSFLFRRDDRLYLVTSRHVVIDEATDHFPNFIELELHGDPENLADSAKVTVPLYDGGRARWRQGKDAAGEIDVAVLRLKPEELPRPIASYAALTPEHLYGEDFSIEVGGDVLVVCYPLGFHDTLHHLPVVRRAVVASSFGLRFQGQGYFLTDGRTHRGTSGAPVVMRRGGDTGPELYLVRRHPDDLDRTSGLSRDPRRAPLRGPYPHCRPRQRRHLRKPPPRRAAA